MTDKTTTTPSLLTFEDADYLHTNAGDAKRAFVYRLAVAMNLYMARLDLKESTISDVGMGLRDVSAFADDTLLFLKSRAAIQSIKAGQHGFVADYYDNPADEAIRQHAVVVVEANQHFREGVENKAEMGILMADVDKSCIGMINLRSSLQSLREELNPDREGMRLATGVRPDMRTIQGPEPLVDFVLGGPGLLGVNLHLGVRTRPTMRTEQGHVPLVRAQLNGPGRLGVNTSLDH
jgi:hypothetical protein